jgi:type II secretory pathway predicted ATPase ExeA
LEHLEHFGLARDPFRNEVQLDFWFASRAHVDAGRRLRRCVEQGKELCVLVGEVGSGTTTVARALIEQLDPDRFEAGLLVPPRGVDPDALRSAIARQLGVESPPRRRSDAMRQLHAHLVALRGAGRRAAIAIDDAQSLSADALAELHALSSLEHDDERLLSFVLVGSPQLEQTLAHDPDLLARVELRLRLAPLSPAEARSYVVHRVEVAGGDATLFSADVLDAITLRAGGLPRRLNALADNTLFEAHLEGRARPERADVERAARDLPWAQQLQDVATPAAIALAPEKDDDGFDDSFEPEPSLESLRDAASGAGFRDLDLPDLEADLGASVAIELAHAPADGGSTHSERPASVGLELTVREAEIDADLIGPEQTAPGAWHTAAPLEDEDDVTASRRVAPSARPELSMIPDPDELDGLFVDLVDEAEPDS